MNLERAACTPPDDCEALQLAALGPHQRPALLAAASARRERRWGRTVTYSPKVFLPITNLCRNHCSYCAFRRSPGDPGEWTMRPDEVRKCLVEGRALGCAEALLCLGDTPESAFPSYRETLAGLGHSSTVDYLYAASRVALEVGLLPHTNAGLLSSDDMARLREVNVSLGLMLETASDRLSERGMAHHRAPDKRPARRLAMIADAGRLRIPFTTGILIGIGETPRERVEALLAIRRLHREHGHIQEVIVQNFRPHDDTPMRLAAAPPADELCETIAIARLVLDDDVSVQAPPNLSPASAARLLGAGINDFGGISPLTPDYINPGHPWPHLDALAEACAREDRVLAPRLPIYDAFVQQPGWLDPELRAAVEARA